MELLQFGGTALLTNTTLNGRFVPRACILHYGSTRQDIDAILDAVEDAVEQIPHR